MRLYHGTTHDAVVNGSFTNGIDAGRGCGQLGRRFYVTPVIEVAVWFAVFWNSRPAKRDKKVKGIPPPAILVFDLSLQAYWDLLRSARVLGLRGPMAPAYDATKARPPLRDFEHPLVIAPISGDWEHLANGVQYALDERGVHGLRDLVNSAVQGAWHPEHAVFRSELWPFEAWEVRE